MTSSASASSGSTAASARPSLEDARRALQDLVDRCGPEQVPSGTDPDSLTRLSGHGEEVWGIRWPAVERPRASAVLVLFGALDSIPAQHRDGAVHPDVDLLLTQRAATLRQHAGQVAFPGGRCDPEDEDVVATALREAEEETGLDPDGVDVLGVLPPVPLIVSGHVVHPVIGWWREPSRVAVVDHAEAMSVFRVPVADLVAPENRTRVRSPRGTRHLTPGFEVAGTVVWGFTGMIVARVLDLLGWSQPWQDARVVDPPASQLR